MNNETPAHGGQATSSGSGMRGEDQYMRDLYDKQQHQNGR